MLLLNVYTIVIIIVVSLYVGFIVKKFGYDAVMPHTQHTHTVS